MSTKQKAIIVCDFCGKEINTEEPYIETNDVGYEGCSEIVHNAKKNSTIYYVEDGDFCNIACLFNNIKKELKL